MSFQVFRYAGEFVDEPQIAYLVNTQRQQRCYGDVRSIRPDLQIFAAFHEHLLGQALRLKHNSKLYVAIVLQALPVRAEYR